VYNDGVVYFQILNAYGYFTRTGTAWDCYGTVWNAGGATNADKCKIYLNGANQSLSFVGTFPANTGAGGTFNIGRNSQTGVDYQSGLTDIMIIYKEAISSSWNTTFYNNTSSPSNLGSSGFLRFYH
jgi:hypothetical protein